jgi:hypothetical protein
MHSTKWHVAQINIARMIATNINDPVMKTFVDQLDEVNQIADNSKGFVWRLQDKNGNATSINAYDDQRIIVNMSVWETVEDLEIFVYKSMHKNLLKQRRDWFEKFDQIFYAIWYIPENHIPSLEEAKERLNHLQQCGPDEFAFNFNTKFSPPK